MNRFIKEPQPASRSVLAKPGAPRRKPAKAVTLAEVASAAGVAPSTASAVLGDKVYCFASEETRRRIHEAAKALHYRPNSLSRGLQGLSTQKIAVLLSNVGSTSVASDNLRSIEVLAWQHGYRLVLGVHHGEGEREREYLANFESERVDGFIAVPTGDAESQQALADMIERGVPIVMLEAHRSLPLPVPGVKVDRELGGYLQVQHLLELGRKRIAFLFTSTQSPTGEAKIAGIRRALHEAGLELDALPQVTEAGSIQGRGGECGVQMMQALLADGARFDAVVTLSDLVAAGAMQALLQVGRRIPNDVAIVGFDDDAFAPYLPVPLTTIRQPRGEAGEAAFNLLLKQLQPPADPSTSGGIEQVVLQPKLLVRASTVGPGKDKA